MGNQPTILLCYLQISMIAIKALATMEGRAETWSMTFSVNVKMAGKEKPATHVSVLNSFARFALVVFRMSCFVPEFS